MREDCAYVSVASGHKSFYVPARCSSAARVIKITSQSLVGTADVEWAKEAGTAGQTGILTHITTHRRRAI